MTVINTCDYNQTKAATLALADHHGPAPCVLTTTGA
jgi:transketolase